MTTFDNNEQTNKDKGKDRFTIGSYRDGTRVSTGDIRRFTGIPTFLKAPLISEVKNPTVGIVGVPFDGGTIRTPGSRFGPRAIRDYCWRLNEYNAELGVNPYALHNIVDCGDIILSPLSLEDSHDSIRCGIADLIEQGMVPISIGGDHFIAYPILQAIHAVHGKISVIHFDAHTDTADYCYGQKFHHGSIIRHAVDDGLVDGDKLIQIGIRKVFHDQELDYHKDNNIEVITARDLKMMGPGLRDILMDRFKRLKDQKVYITFDIDFVDPTYAPATGSPEVGGPTSDEALECIRALKGLDIVGFDLNEVSPPYDVRDLTSLLAAQVLYEMVSVLKPTN
ncbi:MAG: agmatinase [Rhodospirillales bacterium]|jgi:agmatinase|nr:agmatinase [Rhodospirillales bacterium]